VQVKRLVVKNFRNYRDTTLCLYPQRNILIGENAQGKTNLLEAIEVMAGFRSRRTASDRDLVLKGESQTYLEVTYRSQGVEETVSLLLNTQPRLSRTIKINGMKVPRSETRGMTRLTAVSFSSSDLSLLRGGPKERRDWLDDVVLQLRPGLSEIFARYDKVVSQRNRLFKSWFERSLAPDEEELKVWDVQLAKLGARLVKARSEVLLGLLPVAEANLARISGHREKLEAGYLFKEESGDSEANLVVNLAEFAQHKEEELAKRIYLALKGRRAEELARKQTLAGPHRDDMSFVINDMPAHIFGSQGQQRSLVLALKLAELKLVEDALSEPPLLLLDDVLAELDLGRQGMLMELVKSDMQTIITTTHLDGFKEEWLAGAQIVKVVNGQLTE